MWLFANSRHSISILEFLAKIGGGTNWQGKEKLKATIAEFLFNEICGKAQRLAEGAAKCVRDMEETKVFVLLLFCPEWRLFAFPSICVDYSILNCKFQFLGLGKWLSLSVYLDSIIKKDLHR